MLKILKSALTTKDTKAKSKRNTKNLASCSYSGDPSLRIPRILGKLVQDDEVVKSEGSPSTEQELVIMIWDEIERK